MSADAEREMLEQTLRRNDPYECRIIADGEIVVFRFREHIYLCNRSTHTFAKVVDRLVRELDSEDLKRSEAYAQREAARALLGKYVHFVNDPENIYRVIGAASDGMIEIDGFSSQFAPHLFKVKKA